jgi:hypothetical protein
MNMIPENLKKLIVTNCEHYNYFVRLSLEDQSTEIDRIIQAEYHMTVDAIATTLKMLGYEVVEETETIESRCWYGKIITAVKVNNEVVFSELVNK